MNQNKAINVIQPMENNDKSQIQHSDKIRIQILARNRIGIVSAPCGFGKSTHLILLLKELFPAHQIVVTQPRRITVTQLAQRVKQLCRQKYQIRYAIQFEDQSKYPFDVLYITEGLLLQKLINNPSIIQNKIFVLDEVHELSNNMILLLCILKKITAQYHSVRLFVCSASADIQLFKQYLNCQALEIKIPKQYNVSYEMSNVLLDINDKMYLNTIANQILNSVRNLAEINPYSSILVFLPGQYEIELLYEKIHPFTQDGQQLQSYRIVFIYASLNEKYICTQNRSIYLATNLAETSLTLPNISVVIDSGLQKKIIYNSLIKNYQLVTTFISKSNMQQRSGRTGRTCDGKYIGVYHVSQLQEKQYIEIENNNLCSTILTYLLYFKTFEGIDLIINMKYQHLKRNIQVLYNGQLINREGTITDLGQYYLQHLYIDDINYINLLYASKNTKYYYQIVQLISLLCSIRQCGNRYIDLNTYKEVVNQRNDFQSLISICCILDCYKDVNSIQKKIMIHGDLIKYYFQLKNKIIGNQIIEEQTTEFPIEIFVSVYQETNKLINNNNQYYNDYTKQYVVISKYSQVTDMTSQYLYFDGIFSTEKSTKVYYVLIPQ